MKKKNKITRQNQGQIKDRIKNRPVDEV